MRPARGTLLVLLVAIAGCGGSSSPDPTTTFKRDYKPVVDSFAQTSMAIGHAVENASGQTDAQLAVAFQGFATTWGHDVSALQALKPPSSVATAFTTMSAAVGRAQSDLLRIVHALQTHTSSAASSASSALVTDIVAGKAAALTINKRLGVS